MNELSCNSVGILFFLISGSTFVSVSYKNGAAQINSWNLNRRYSVNIDRILTSYIKMDIWDLTKNLNNLVLNLISRSKHCHAGSRLENLSQQLRDYCFVVPDNRSNIVRALFAWSFKRNYAACLEGENRAINILPRNNLRPISHANEATNNTKFPSRALDLAVKLQDLHENAFKDGRGPALGLKRRKICLRWCGSNGLWGINSRPQNAGRKIRLSRICFGVVGRWTSFDLGKRSGLDRLNWIAS